MYQFIIITIEGGIVTKAASNIPHLCYRVIDHDSHTVSAVDYEVDEVITKPDTYTDQQTKDWTRDEEGNFLEVL